ncbi:MAG: hypothetical protein K1X35_02475 [Caulobacteraceae bacterium]|nr:hypothetical protein [Caulobacteraceae bacterium]
MAVDLMGGAERREGDRWVALPGAEPFNWRSYAIFGFLADVRNYSHSPVISPPRGLPADVSPEIGAAGGGLLAISWLTLEELLAYDYEIEFEDRRTIETDEDTWTFEASCPAGAGVRRPLRSLLGPRFFQELKRLKAFGAERIVFGFHSSEQAPTQREPGLYWVKWFSDKEDRAEPAELTETGWVRLGGKVADPSPRLIGPRIEPPEFEWYQSVPMRRNCGD